MHPVQGRTTGASIEHEPALDGLRGVAVLMVLIIHLLPLQVEGSVSLVVSRASGLFWLGVDLFFVLSGYLITRILLHTSGRPGYYRSFLWRRTLRIFPAYFLVLGLVLFVLPVVHAPLRDSGLVKSWYWFGSYLQNWHMALHHRGFAWPGVNHFWSLAIEEQFYLGWPLVVALAGATRLRAVCVGLIVGCMGLRAFLYLHDAHWTFLYFSTVTRVDGLAAGALIATLSARQARQCLHWAAPIGLLALTGLIALSGLGGKLNSARDVTIATSGATVAFGSLVLLIHARALTGWGLTLLTAPSLRWLGQYSYGIYLLHYVLYWPVRAAFTQALPDWEHGAINQLLLLTGVVTLILSLAAAWIMYHAWEQPFLRLREPARRPATPLKPGVA